MIDCPARPERNPIMSLAVPSELHFRVEIEYLTGRDFSISRHFDHPTHGVQIGVRAGVGNDLSDETLCSNRS